jgi:hypothetical protein
VSTYFAALSIHNHLIRSSLPVMKSSANFYLHLLQPQDDVGAQTQQQQAIFTRMSDSFVHLMFGIPADFKDDFFEVC